MKKSTLGILIGVTTIAVAAGLASEWIGTMVGLSPMRIIRWVALGAATVLVSMIFVITLKGLWTLDQPSAKVRVAPFTVIDPSGVMTNAESGLASLLVARIAHIRSDIERSRDQFEESHKPGDSATLLEPSEPVTYGTGAQSSETTRPPLLAEMFASTGKETLPELSVQGVDLTGLFAWVKRNLRDRQKAINFTAYIDKSEGVSIAGDIAHLALGENAKTLFIPAEKGKTPAEAVERLAHLIYQHALSGSEPQVLSLTPDQFRRLITALAALENPQQDYWEAVQKRQHVAEQYQVIDNVLGRFENWPKLSVVAGRAAWLAGKNKNARNHFQSALTVAQRNDDAQMVAAIEYHLEQVDGALAARTILASAKTRNIAALVHPPTTTSDGTQSAPSETALVENEKRPFVRKSVSNLTAAELAIFREGFTVLQAARGDGSLNAFAGIYRQYFSQTHGNEIFLPWNRAFLALVETEVREEVPEFAFACWDFDQLQVPAAFTKEVENGQPNPLFRGTVTTGSTEKVSKPRYTLRENIDLATRNNVITRFQGVKEALLNSEWELAHRSIEGQLNNLRHVLVGGDMATLTSIYDPLFFAHRCAVDRLWAEWETRHESEPYSAATLDLSLEPFGIKVRDVIKSASLGYIYDTDPTD